MPRCPLSCVRGSRFPWRRAGPQKQSRLAQNLHGQDAERSGEGVCLFPSHHCARIPQPHSGWTSIQRAFAQGSPATVSNIRTNCCLLQIGIRLLLLEEFNESGTFHEVPGGISSHYKIIIHNVTLLCAVSLREKRALQLLETEVPPDKVGLPREGKNGSLWLLIRVSMLQAATGFSTRQDGCAVPAEKIVKWNRQWAEP